MNSLHDEQSIRLSPMDKIVDNLDTWKKGGRAEVDKIVEKYAVYYINNSEVSDAEHWRRFRVLLFVEVRKHVRRSTAIGERPRDALKSLPCSVSKMAQRFNLIKLAVKVEASDPTSPVSTWALGELVSGLAHTAREPCRAARRAPRTLPPRALGAALVRLREEGVAVQCTRAALEDVWHRLCKLKTWQLYRLSRRGDRTPRAELRVERRAERLAPHDWHLIDTLLLYDPDEELTIIAPWSLKHVATYRSLALLVLLLARAIPAGPSRRSTPRWPLAHARYELAGRSASLILLQRRWYYLQKMALAANDRGEEHMHPLLELILHEFKGSIMRDKKSWMEIVYKGLYVSENSNSKELWRHGERRMRWQITDYKRLEKLKTVEEIDEYLNNRLRDSRDCDKMKKNLNILEAWNSVSDQNCSTNVTSSNVSDNKDPDDSNDGNITTEQANTSNDTNTLTLNNIVNTEPIHTIEALKRIDPNAAQVTVEFESDSDEPSNLIDVKIKVEEELRPKTEKYAVEHNQSKDVSDIKEESKDFQAEDNTQSMLIDVPTISNNKSSVADRIKFIDEEDEAMEVEEKDSNDISDLNESKPVVCNDDAMAESSIDSKLLCMTSVKLTRIDESPTWIKHAHNDSINVKWADSNADDNNLLSPVGEIKIEDDKKRDLRVFKLDLKPELHRVSESVLRTNKILLEMCQPVSVRLRKLQESEIPRSRVVKKVELPNIDEVRRINSSILTAEVKPIPLKDQSNGLTDEDTGSADYVDLSKELDLLDQDIKRMFKLTPAEYKAVIDEAVNLDYPRHFSEIINTSNVFLDQDDEDKDQNQTSAMNSDEDSNKKKKKEIERKRKKKDNKEKEKEKQDGSKKVKKKKCFEPIDENKEKEKETQVWSKKVKKKKKRKKKQSFEPIEEPKLDAYEEWERQKQMNKKYFMLGQTGGSKNSNKANETKESNKEVNKEANKEVNKESNKEVNKEANKETKVTNSDVKNVTNQNQPQVISLGTKCDANLQGLLNDSLTKLLNVVPNDPSVENLKVMANPIKSDDVVVIDDDDEDSSVKKEVPSQEVTPKIAAVFSLAQTQSVDEVPDNTGALGCTRPIRPLPEAALKTYYHITPSRTEVTVPLGAGVSQRVAITRNMIKVKVSSNLQAKRGNEQSSSIVEPSELNKINSKLHLRTFIDSRINQQRKKIIPPNEAQTQKDITTPQEYMQSDNRRDFIVIKMDMYEPVWTVNNKYFIVTEENLPCENPEYFTAGRDPPGQCQLLIWPKDGDNIVADPTDNLNPIVENNADNMEVDNDEAITEAKQLPKMIPCSCPAGKSKTDKDVDLTIKIDNTVSNDQRDVNNLVVYKSNEEFNGRIVIDKGVITEIVRNDHNYSTNRLEDDSDSDSNGLLIDEGDGLEVKAENDFVDDRIKSESDIDKANEVDLNNVNFSDHTYSKFKDVDKEAEVNKPKSIIKVRSFANVDLMEAKSLVNETVMNPDIIEKDNKFYKKLIDKPVVAYALMLSVVPSVSECDRLLREGAPLWAIERDTSALQPFHVRGELDPMRDPGDPNSVRLEHNDPIFLHELVEQLSAYISAYRCEDVAIVKDCPQSIIMYYCNTRSNTVR